MPKFILFALFAAVFCYPSRIAAQPYFDVAGISGWNMPVNLNLDNVTETEGHFFIAIPVDLGERSKLIVSPFYETRRLESEDKSNFETLKSTSLPVVWRYEPPDSTWSFVSLVTFRSNSTQFRFNGDVFQVVGAVLANYRVSPTLTLKAGLYLSREFFGTFFIILAGIDWKINDRMNLFGLVNHELKLEYRFTEKFYGGFKFKSINNSYRDGGYGGYYKINDNQLGIYTDISLGKKMVWNLEAGHSILRTIKSREGADFPEINKDGFVFKTGIAYRIRFY